MKATLTTACVVGLFAAQPAQRPLTTSAIANEWIDAVEAHEPGKRDAPLQKIATWNADRLARTIRGIRTARPTETLNELLERGALLHGDITLLNPDALSPTRVEGWTPPVDARLVRDGQTLGDSSMDAHVYYARALLWSMRPPAVVTIDERPSVGLARRRAWEMARAANPRIRQWYRALSAHFAARRWLSDQLPHLDDAARMIKGDMNVSFDAGCYGEAIAAPAIQRSLERGGAPVRKTPQQLTTALLLSSGFNLDNAERQYRDVLKQEPHHTEARVRLAHVLTRRGSPGDALALLHPPIEAEDPIVRYYGAMVVAEVSEATGQLDAAQEAYEQAAMLFPRAQSPLLALLRLARERADEATVKALAAKAAALSPHAAHRLDPWWNYYDCNGRNRDAEVERLWAMYRTRETR